MAQYITSLSFGAVSVHLSHTGQCVFSSSHYMTGGCMVSGIIFRDGCIRDARQPKRDLREGELRQRLGVPHVSHWQVFGGKAKEWAEGWMMALRTPRKVRWNPHLE